MKTLECKALCGQLNIKRERGQQIEYCSIAKQNCSSGLPNITEDCPYRKYLEMKHGN